MRVIYNPVSEESLQYITSTDDFVPYVGATGSLEMGAQAIKTTGSVIISGTSIQGQQITSSTGSLVFNDEFLTGIGSVSSDRINMDSVAGLDGTKLFEHEDVADTIDFSVPIETLGNNINVGAGTVTANSFTDTTATLTGGTLSALTGGLTTDADNAKLIMGTGSDGEIYVDANDDLILSNVTQDKDILLKIDDGGVTKTLIKLDGDTGNVDMTAAGITYVSDLDVDSPSNVYNLSHDSFADFVADEHIDWTDATDDLVTTGDGTFAKLGVGDGISSHYGTYLEYKDFSAADSKGALNVNMILGEGESDNTAILSYGARLNAQTSATYTGNYTGGAMIGFSNVVNHYGSGTCKNLWGTSAQIACRDGSGLVTNARTFYVYNPAVQGSGSLTNAYGIWIEDITAGGTTNKAIVLDGDSDGGSLYFGAGQDSYVWYDGTDLVVNPKLVGTGQLSVSGAIRSGQTTCDASSDAFNVAGVNSLLIDTGDGAVVLGGLAGGIAGQILCIAISDVTNAVTLEHNEGTGTQKLIMHDASDETLTNYGGWTMVCDGTYWYDISHAKHV